MWAGQGFLMRLQLTSYLWTVSNAESSFPSRIFLYQFTRLSRSFTSSSPSKKTCSTKRSWGSGGFSGERTQEYYVVDAMTIVLSSPSVQIPRQSDWAKCPKDTRTGCGPPPAAVPALSTVVVVQRPTAVAETANAGNATGLAYVSSPAESVEGNFT
uniref:Uncharacterized protein n=1 Tax=Coccidioides posadasii RMSCC 3488 TaxID=454284 RepID=A0A0J6ICJ6_COCPO|nr:hypothetical protein CPAG_05723 [Coccidioides posadasii RMSCC 3488]